MNKCGRKWLAPLLMSNNTTRYINQVCVRPKGHPGPHISSTKVIKKEKVNGS